VTQTQAEQLPDFGPRADAAVAAACASFPATFGLRAYPGKVFRLSESASYVSRGAVVLYTQRQVSVAEYVALYGSKPTSVGQLWLDFAKGDAGELRAALVAV
jgi:hypothetical protein